MWDTVKTMTNMNSTKKPLHAVDELSTANELERFYIRFETHDFSAECVAVFWKAFQLTRLIGSQSRQSLLTRPLDQMEFLHLY